MGGKIPRLGTDISLGVSVREEERFVMPGHLRDRHLYVCGATGSGKSKMLEYLLRQDILGRKYGGGGLLLLDPHGSLYDSLMNWLSWHEVDVPIIPIDLRQEDWTVAYNPLRPRATADPNVIVSQFVDSIAYVWGASGTDETPRFAHWANTILRTLYEKRLTLVESEILTDPVSKRGRHAITDGLTLRRLRNDWAFADTLSAKDFFTEVGSTVNRLNRFGGTDVMRRMFGQTGPSLDLLAALEEGHIILVNLATEGAKISPVDASLFATLLLSDLWSAAKERGKPGPGKQVRPFRVYIDEFQNYVTPTIAKNLDEARGYGLHLTLCHQFPQQLFHAGANGAQVLASVMANARSKVVFGMGSDEANLRPLALDLFMGVMDPNKIKHELFSTKVMGYYEDYRTAYARAESRSEGRGSQSGMASGKGLGGTTMFPFEDASYASGVSESLSEFNSTSESNSQSHATGHTESESQVPVMVPMFGKELSSVQFEPLEEQLFRAMAVLFDLKQRQCVARIVETNKPVLLHTPIVKTYSYNPERVRGYTQSLMAKWNFILPGKAAQKALDDREAVFMGEVVERKVAELEPKSTRRRIG